MADIRSVAFPGINSNDQLADGVKMTGVTIISCNYDKALMYVVVVVFGIGSMTIV